MFRIYAHPKRALQSFRRYDALRNELLQILRDVDSPYTYEQRVHEALQGKINFPDALFLQALLEKYRPKTILEIGSFLGFSTRWLLETSAPWGAQVTSLDPNIRHRIYNNPNAVLRRLTAKFADHLDVVEAFFGPCGECVYDDYEKHEPRMTRPDAQKIISSRPVLTGSWDRKFDFIFIDGDHSEQAVEADFRNAQHLLNPGGVIAFHDVLLWEGVQVVLDRLKEEFRGRAEVRVLGRAEHAILRPLGKTFGGIGVFRLLPPSHTSD
jgi:predicted O-methyltransferase YrrM